ncbi:hypothetical protein KJ854_03730 [Patescibacteria group bacterium]|nr:hypothetical protein [Patescibacteria group bacterium]MBU4142041.1 hypothetical protein [Patescibacteria group bacterium]
MKPQGKVKIKWSAEFSYAIGLMATDGNLSSNGRQFDFTSNDKEQVENFKKCFGLKNKISLKSSGSSPRSSFHVQFGDIRFYTFLLSIGLTSKKSKTMGELTIPDKYFFDFLRGHFDGDGTFYSYWDPRWRSSFMFYIELTSASKNHILWLQKRIFGLRGIKGRITKSRNNSAYRLKYAKAESLKLLPKLYYDKFVICLSRKRKKIEQALKIAGKKL